MNPHLKFAQTLALDIGKFLLERFKSQDNKPRQKADHSLVTEADLEADRRICKAIQNQFPDDDILSEEGNTTFTGENPITWVIDPLDGTANFSLGLHHWGVSIARLVDGHPDLAALYFPILDELYAAQRGDQAYLNQQPLHIPPPDKNQPASFFTSCSRTHRRYHVNLPYKTRILGSAAYAFCAVARGAAILGLETTPKIWDLAGGWLILEEAGGLAQTLHGPAPFPLTPAADYQTISIPTLIAASPEILALGQENIQLKPPAKNQI